MWNQWPSFRFEIDNFSEKEADVASQVFVSGGCEWYLSVYPKGGVHADGHLSLYLTVGNRTTLRTGWKRSAKFYFVLLNQSDKELYRSSIIQTISHLFCAETPSLGFSKTLLLSKLQEKGFLEKDRLIIEVYIKNVEAVDGDVPEKKTVDVNGFQVLASQVSKVRKIFAEHPDIAKDFKPTQQEVKTAYMNVLLRLIKTLQKPSKSLSDTRLNKACSELSELMNVGFKLDWLKLKLEEVSLERKTSDADASRVLQLEERVKNLEIMELGFKLESLNTKLDEVSLEKKKSDDTEESRAEQERVKNLEVTRLGFRLDCLNLKLDTVLSDTKKSHDAVVSRVEQLEEGVRDLGVRLDYLYTTFKEISLETKKTDDADGSPVQQLEESVKNIELMVSQLKVELDKKKDKSSADGFLLVDEFA